MDAEMHIRYVKTPTGAARCVIFRNSALVATGTGTSDRAALRCALRALSLWLALRDGAA